MTTNGRSLAHLNGLVRECFITGKYGKGGSYVVRIVNQQKERLRSVVTPDGEPSVYEEAQIQSVGRCEAEALLIQQWLKEPDVPRTERCEMLKQIRIAGEARERCLRRLSLNTTPESSQPPKSFAEGFADAEAKRGHPSDVAKD